MIGLTKMKRVMIASLLLALSVTTVHSAIYLEDNAYQQVVIVIGDRVKEDWGLVDKIKKVFTDASESLHIVTR